ncbi:MAG: hypothetical protein U0074_05300 [Kouleothrix sp.]
MLSGKTRPGGQQRMAEVASACVALPQVSVATGPTGASAPASNLAAIAQPGAAPTRAGWY